MSLGYADRLANYLRQRPNASSAPELTHLTGPQRRRLRHKMNHRKRQAVLRNYEGRRP